MKGLLLKDVYTFYSYKKNLLLMLVLGIFLSFTLNMVTMIPAYLMLVSVSYATGLFSYDETAKFDRFALTLPVTRKQTVLSRYLLIIGLLFVLGVVSIVAGFAVLMIKGSPSEAFLEMLLVAAVMLVIALLVLSILLPVCYRFGAEKGRVAITLAFALVFGSFMLMMYFFSDSLVTVLETSGILIAGIGVGVTALLLVISLYLSLRFYSKKEF